MFDLDQAIAEWRRRMLAAGIKTPVPLDELVSHLRDDIEQRRELGLSEEEGFERAIQEIGQAPALQREFAKRRARDRREGLLKMCSLIWVGLVLMFTLLAVYDHDPRDDKTTEWLVVICAIIGAISGCKSLRAAAMQTPLRWATHCAFDSLLYSIILMLFYMQSLHHHDRFLRACFLISFVASVGATIAHCMIVGASYSAARKSRG
jgi:hypothetical protein